MAQRRQHHKGKKRPGSWHQGRSEGVKQNVFLEGRFEPAVERADADQVEIVQTSKRHRAIVRDHVECLRQIDCSAPFVPRWEIRL